MQYGGPGCGKIPGSDRQMPECPGLPGEHQRRHHPGPPARFPEEV